MITKIYLDLDDVLNTFTPCALFWVGCDIQSTDYSKHPVECGYDIVAAANILHKNKQFTVEGFWKEIDICVWALAPKSAEFNLLIKLSEEAVGRENIRILTKATLDPACLAGKKKWMRDNLPAWLSNRYHIVGDDCKSDCANPQSLLIDDNEENVAAFRKAGGQAMMMPRPWNFYRNVKSNEAYLLEMFRGIFGDRISL